jgi:hypothetical protein
MFTSILYMFRATSCSSSGESIVSIQHLACVSHSDRLVCRSGSSFPTCILDGHLHRVTHTRCCIDTINSPDDEHEVARNMYRIQINIYKKEFASRWSFTRILSQLNPLHILTIVVICHPFCRLGLSIIQGVPGGMCQTSGECFLR